MWFLAMAQMTLVLRRARLMSALSCFLPSAGSDSNAAMNRVFFSGLLHPRLTCSARMKLHERLMTSARPVCAAK